MNNKTNYKRKYLIVLVLSIGIIFLGGTFSKWIWRTFVEQRSDVAFSVTTDDYSCSADGGGNITSNDINLIPTSCTNMENAIKREIIVEPTINKDNFMVSMNLWLNINDIGQGLSDSVNFRYALTNNDNSCTDGVISEGNFNGKSIGDKVDILNNKGFNSTVSEKYYLYIWLDRSETSKDTMNQSFDLSLGGSCDGITVANKPVLDEGMIPVTISNDGTVTTIDENDSNWYDYNEQKWANIVLVNENATEGVEGSQSREYYKNNTGVEVLESDILAYYTWIPRYKYILWTTDRSDTGSEQEIDIEFEGVGEKYSSGTKVGKYRTHPAFWWDVNNDGNITQNEILPGIWVGKFETTGTEDRPTVLPNVSSFRSQNISTHFQTSLKFAGGNMNTSTGNVSFSGSNTYGLTIDTDSHMMKNTEWGAVAYLSHSRYGINDEVRINNYYNEGTLTGCGALTSDEAVSTTCGITYGGALEYPQSTTGNITGVYDMSGGLHESVMGVMVDSNGQPRTGKDNTYNSGFSGLLYDDTIYNGISFPEKKYYDKFSGTVYLSLCMGEICYGHALSETRKWYADKAYFVDNQSSWFVRGGDYSYNTEAGIYSSTASVGGNATANYINSFRSVLIPVDYVNITFDVNGGTISNVSTYTTSGEHIYTVPYDGNYKLEVWGAQGGDASSLVGGYGGYSVGSVVLNGGDKLYVNVGGKGQNGVNATNTSTSGGYNGGGTGYVGGTAYYVGGGGGATHVATLSGLLSTFENNKNKVLIVAGGGGGVAYLNETARNLIVGHGGGFEGVGGRGQTASGTVGDASGGTQSGSGTSGYTKGGFGYGANGVNASHAGGGGGFYGGNINVYSGGGGSGYIGNSLLTNKAMYCYSCTTSSDVDTLTYSTNSVSSNPVSNYAKSGNGAAVITLINFDKKLFLNEKYGELPVPSKNGYNFLGWYTDPIDGDLITSDIVVNNSVDHTLYAHWGNSNSYTVSFDANGGEGAPSSQTKFNGQTLKLSTTIPTRIGYTFLGWSTSLSSTSVAYSAGGSYTANEGATLYAVWRTSKVVVGFHVNGGSVTSSTVYTDGTTNNWTTSDGLVYRNGSLAINTIKYGESGGSLSDYNNSKFMEIKRTGYTAVSGAEWICSSGCTTANKTFDQTVSYASSEFCDASYGDCTVTLKVNWKANTYTISYNANEGSGAPSSQTKTYGQTLTLSSTKPTRTGYTFLGWSTSSTATSASYSAGGSYTANSAATLYAVWRKNRVIIQYHVNGGSITSSTVYNDGTTYNWTTSDGLVYRNGGLQTTKINYGESGNLTNYNNSNFMEIKRTGYAAASGAEWICSSGCTTANKTFDHLVDYASSEFCNATNGDCTVTLKVNWKSSPVNSYSCANSSKGSEPYIITYTGNCTVINDGSGNWRVKFLTGGTFTSTTDMNIDAFLVGGGGGGGDVAVYTEGNYWGWSGGGGGGGYTKNGSVSLKKNNTYNIVIGAGGAARTDGGTTSAFGLTANGGKGAYGIDGANGGSGGGEGNFDSTSTGAAGGSNGSDGGSSSVNNRPGGIGQKTTTCEFGQGTYGGSCNSGVTMYSGGGGGGAPEGSGTPGAGGSGGGARGNTSASANTGGGGGGGYEAKTGGSGGSGIVVIRNKR